MSNTTKQKKNVHLHSSLLLTIYHKDAWMGVWGGRKETTSPPTVQLFSFTLMRFFYAANLHQYNAETSRKFGPQKQCILSFFFFFLLEIWTCIPHLNPIKFEIVLRLGFLELASNYCDITSDLHSCNHFQ